MIPTAITADRDSLSLANADSTPCYFVDATYDATDDSGDWWLDLGAVHLPA